MSALKPGDMIHQVEVQRAALLQDESGQMVDEDGNGNSTWFTLCTRWAQVMPLTGRELETAKQINALINLRVRMWYMAGINELYRLKYGNRVFQIAAVLNDGELNTSLTLLCIERKP